MVEPLFMSPIDTSSEGAPLGVRTSKCLRSLEPETMSDQYANDHPSHLRAQEVLSGNATWIMPRLKIQKPSRHWQAKSQRASGNPCLWLRDY